MMTEAQIEQLMTEFFSLPDHEQRRQFWMLMTESQNLVGLVEQLGSSAGIETPTTPTSAST